MDSDGVWHGSIGMGRKEGNRGNPGEIYKMVTIRADWRTPGYMIREEVKRDKMRTRAGRRA